MKAVKRAKATPPAYKLPLALPQITRMCDKLDPHDVMDAQMRAIILSCFYGLFRISNVIVPHTTNWDMSKALLHGDITFCAEGCILKFRWSKTIQYHERTLDITLPRIHRSPICPTDALVRFFTLAGKLPNTVPAFAVKGISGPIVPPHPGGYTRQVTRSVCFHRFASPGLQHA